MEDDSNDADIEVKASAWRIYASIVVCVLGLADATYLTLTHYTNVVPLVCSSTGIVNCAQVTSSPQSYVFGIPVALLGIVYFIPMLILSLPFAWRSKNHIFAWLRLTGAVTGIGFVAYLVYSELFVIKKICLYCTGVHLLTFILFVIVVTGWEAATAFWD